MKLPFLPTVHPMDPGPRPPAVLPLPSHLRGPAKALYVVAGAVTAIPLFQIAPHILPIELLSTPWRYTAYSALAGTIVAPLGGLVLAHWIAAIENNRPRQALISAISFLAGVVLLVCAPLFLHDYLALRDEAARSMRGAIDSAAWRALFAGIAGGATLCVVGLSGWRSADTPAPGQIRKKGGKGGLVIAQDAEDTVLVPSPVTAEMRQL